MDALLEQVKEDLRRRGYKVEKGIGGIGDFMAYKGNEGGLFKVLREGQEVPLRDIALAAEAAERLGLKLVLALVSNDGTVTYYRTFRLKLREVPRRWNVVELT